MADIVTTFASGSIVYIGGYAGQPIESGTFASGSIVYIGDYGGSPIPSGTFASGNIIYINAFDPVSLPLVPSTTTRYFLG